MATYTIFIFRNSIKFSSLLRRIRSFTLALSKSNKISFIGNVLLRVSNVRGLTLGVSRRIHRDDAFFASSLNRLRSFIATARGNTRVFSTILVGSTLMFTPTIRQISYKRTTDIKTDTTRAIRNTSSLRNYLNCKFIRIATYKESNATSNSETSEAIAGASTANTLMRNNCSEFRVYKRNFLTKSLLRATKRFTGYLDPA